MEIPRSFGKLYCPSDVSREILAELIAACDAARTKRSPTDGGRVIYLEGSYVNTFSGNPHPTPYHEYNQPMYRLDLADPRLKLPAATSEGSTASPR
jgi:hypothetical protein